MTRSTSKKATKQIKSSLSRRSNSGTSAVASSQRLTKAQIQAKRFAIESARLLADRHCHDILVLCLLGLSDLTDYLVIASGTSDRQIRSVADDLDELAADHDRKTIGREIDPSGSWVVLDYVDTVIHLFDPMIRAHYDLEMLWGDAPRIDWRKKK